ncbi:hypothetical protein ACHAW6_005403 [Cyclotella cf. meneghiniana]
MFHAHKLKMPRNIAILSCLSWGLLLLVSRCPSWAFTNFPPPAAPYTNSIPRNGDTSHTCTPHVQAAECERTTPSLDWIMRNLQYQYHKSGGILYKQSILTTHEYTSIIKELASVQLILMDEQESSFATKRIGCRIPNESEIYSILSDQEGSLCRLLNGLQVRDGSDPEPGPMVLAPDIPIELRIYEKTGAGMEWHTDDILYNPPQLEVVLTLENTSDCSTMWKPHNNRMQHSKEGEKAHSVIESVQTTPNSGLILKAGGVEHKVSSLGVGRRVILKLAFVRQGAVLLKDMVMHASHHASGGKGKNKRKTLSRKR